ncbi:lysophospholipase [bacterium (Candidatus Blackallbacteria) CG17_big_fil_post_rev_8_21_14_2_50_48_46]|uniref:Lysophospholipase n=1 Tax=bacterium (Candidatus Blackallbacteria) CG17_big_fil_post_rev_8_21_14_2_50_48_46 TaxID=2014261 RepID=A0A2M7G7Z7_9BACT|nr:MAG: lysophospholipase [bacterium (Candidatus Blackallbacteria) CG18_big_fil_WC_8_21_14_2_50_49_26]PIW17884.1 MAG: lysophospholipase [bacterium (Candidatus Blackallbacteria) CG17_big_fil_post_rev_8_21_14_2_50_48_46]PIW48560.1 MAG: lysophospholipase [bacterium (Candidatus Blackallbacteria) CG13_big_fil_rev_8_21_14_2_50_49_14]
MHHFLALGDSYTIGEGLTDKERWPQQLTQGLRNRGLEIADPQIIAQTGWTTQDLRKAIAEASLTPPYDLVSLLIGVNNQYQDRSEAEYEQEFELLLRQAIALAGMRKERVFVLSIPDWGVTPFAKDRDRAEIASAIDGFNRINARLSYQFGVQYLNITTLSRDMGKFQQLVGEDGLHPSAEMYRRWVDQLIDRARRELTELSIRNES